MLPLIASQEHAVLKLWMWCGRTPGRRVDVPARDLQYEANAVAAPSHGHIKEDGCAVLAKEGDASLPCQAKRSALLHG